MVLLGVNARVPGQDSKPPHKCCNMIKFIQDTSEAKGWRANRQKGGVYMTKFFNLEEEHVKKIYALTKLKNDNQYVVLQHGHRFSDIAQWSDKYQNVRIITVPTEKLDRRLELVIK